MSETDVFIRARNFLSRCQFIFYGRKLFGAARWPLLALALVRLGATLLTPPLSVALAGYGLALAWLCYRLAAAVLSLPPGKIGLVNRLVDRDSDWEVVRAGLDSSFPPRDYYQNRLERELEDFFRRKTPAMVLNKNGRRRLVGSLAAVLLILPLGLLPTPGYGPAKPGPGSLALSVSPDVVLPGDTAVVRLRGQAAAAPPRLLIGESGADFTRAVDWSRDETGFYWTSFPLDSSKELYLAREEWREKKAELRVVARPRLQKVTTRVYPPEYTGLPARKAGGDEVEVFPGSSLRVRARATRELGRLQLTNRAGEVLSETTDTDRLAHSHYVLNPGTYRITGADSHGFKSEAYSYRVTLKQDPAPKLTLVEPGEGDTVPVRGLVDVKLEYSDRFGLTDAGLKAWQDSGDTWQTELAVPGRQPEGELYGHIDLDALDLSPGQTFKFTVYARDLDDVLGPKKTELGPIRLKTYTWKQIMADDERSRERGSSGLKKMSQNISNLQKEMEELIRTGKPDDWETARKLRKIQEKLERKKQQLKQAQQNLEDYREGPPGLSTESLKRLSEIQSMVKKHGLKSLQRSQNALKKQVEADSFSASDLQYSKKQLEEFEKDIRRTHEYLENIEPALEVDRMAQTLKQMASEQRKLDELDREKRRRKLEKQAKQWEWMKDKLEQVSEEAGEEMAGQLKQIRKSMEKSNLSEKARSLASAAASKKLGDYRRRTEELMKQMKGATASQFSRQQQQQRSLQEKLVDYWTSWHVHLQRWARRADELKVPPRFLAQYGAELEDLHRALDGFSRLKQGWEQLASTTRQVAALDLNFPREIVNSMDDQAEQLDKIYGWMSERQLGRVNANLPDFVAGQAKFIRKFLKWNRQQQPGGGGAASLQQMLSGQRQLRQQTLPLYGQQKVSPQTARRLARQQRMIRQSLQKMSRQAQQRKDIMGDLERLVDSMKEAEQKMEKREFDAQLRQKQDKILNRLEQATKNIEAESARRQQVNSDRKSSAGLEVEAESGSSDYQEIMNEISDDLEGLSSSQREEVIKFYRFFYRDGGAEDE